ncbi:MAG: AAA family ATPase [Bryobacterales bacterium]|nr:AAA family ATPase [Bryobacterales bacterium]
MLGDKRFLQSIQARNILSFGPDTPHLPLLALNVLIGPNGSGKSNLIELISLLKSSPGNLVEPVHSGGGIGEWLWKGVFPQQPAHLEIVAGFPQGKMPLRHRLALNMVGQRAELTDEAIENERPQSARDPDVFFYYRYQGGRPVLNTAIKGSKSKRELRREDLPPDQSVLSQRKDPDLYPEITFLGREYARIRFFRDWSFHRGSKTRTPQLADSADDFLFEDASNLALVLNNIIHQPGGRARILEALKDADGAIDDLTINLKGGTVQLFLHYSGLATPVPASRLSDGTLRYLAILSILCHSEPPPLVCLEEPELGLHPDLLPRLANLLVDASHRMQLIVTTHSDILVDALSQTPEAVVVCEKHDGKTTMTRRTAAELQAWLKDYGLGQLWRSGEIGGNRW